MFIFVISTGYTDMGKELDGSRGERYLSAKDVAPDYLKESEILRDIHMWYRYPLSTRILIEHQLRYR